MTYPPPGAPPGPPQGQQPPPPAYASAPMPSPYHAYGPPGKEDIPPWVVVLVVVLIIAFSGVMTVIWLATSGPADDIAVEMTTVNLANPQVETRTVGEEVYYDATMNINKITPRGENVAWEDVRVIVISSDGSVLLTATQPSWHDPAEYDDGSDGSVDVQVWYVCSDAGPNMREGDALKLTGMTLDYEGALIEVTLWGERIASVVLPTDLS